MNFITMSLFIAALFSSVLAVAIFLGTSIGLANRRNLRWPENDPTNHEVTVGAILGIAIGLFSFAILHTLK